MRTSEGHATTPDGVRLFYRALLGGGPQTVVLPNGMYLLEDLGRLADGRALVFYDLRNRGLSDSDGDADRLKRGVLQDADDLDALRRHLALARIDVVAHSYVGVTAVLYALRYPAHVDRVVQIGPSAPVAGTHYPAALAFDDGTSREVFAQIAKLGQELAGADPVERCRRIWEVLAALYVSDRKDAGRVRWGRCELPNERNFMRYWSEHVLPSLTSLESQTDALAKVETPVLTIHGTKDRSAPYGGGRDWAMLLKNARLLTVEGAGHAPWIEAPELVLGSIREFLEGAWPEAARKVERPQPGG